MSKKPVEKNADAKEEKIVTKYDRKVAKRKAEEKKAKRNKLIAKIAGFVVLAAAIVALVVTTVINVNRIFREYIKVDEKSISQIEFDFYYGLTKNAELSTTLYGSMTYLNYYESYLGYDAEKRDDKQDYSDELTWYDHFAAKTTDAMIEYKALLKAADEAGYEYTTWEEDYEEFETGMKDSAASLGESVSDYYKDMFGKYATKSRIKEYVKDYYKAISYYTALREELGASDSEISEYYNENKDDYDLFSYRMFTIKAEDMEDESFETAKSKAEEFRDSVSDEETFITACKSYAPEGDETYESDDASLIEDSSSSYFASYPFSEWLLDGERSEGDVEMFEDSDSNCAYIIYFISREEDAEADEEITEIIIGQKYSEFIADYTDDIKVDVKKKFEY